MIDGATDTRGAARGVTWRISLRSMNARQHRGCSARPMKRACHPPARFFPSARREVPPGGRVLDARLRGGDL